MGRFFSPSEPGSGPVVPNRQSATPEKTQLVEIPPGIVAIVNNLPDTVEGAQNADGRAAALLFSQMVPALTGAFLQEGSAQTFGMATARA